jgi:hypothetical protein
MTMWVCEGGKGCMKPCELNDFMEFSNVESSEVGYCRYTGELKTWKKLV